MRVGEDAPLGVALDPDRLKPEPVGVGDASDRDQDHVGIDDLGLAAGRRLDRRLGAALRRSTFVTFEDSLNCIPCFARMRWNCRPTSRSMPGRTRSRNSTTTTSAPSRRQTEPSSSPITPAPMTRSFFGTLSSSSAPSEETTTFSSISMPGRRVTSEPVAMTMFFVSTTWFEPSSPLTSICPAAAMRAAAVEGVDLVLLQEELDALDVALDALVLEGHHGLEIELRRRDADPHLAEVALRLLEALGGVQQRLRRDAADVEAGAAMGLALLDHGGVQPELRRANGADIAAGAGSDDDEIVGHGGSKRLSHSAAERVRDSASEFFNACVCAFGCRVASGQKSIVLALLVDPAEANGRARRPPPCGSSPVVYERSKIGPCAITGRRSYYAVDSRSFAGRIGVSRSGNRQALDTRRSHRKRRSSRCHPSVPALLRS